MKPAILIPTLLGGFWLLSGCQGVGDEALSDFESVEAPLQAAYSPVADSYVTDAHAARNYGAASALLVDDAPVKMKALLKFSVPALGGPVQSAKLRMHVTDWSPDGPKVYRASSSWSESRVTWSDCPGPSGPVVADAGEMNTGWYELDVTSAVTGAGDVTFLLLPDSTDGVDVASRESSNKPQLVIVTGTSSSSEGVTHVGSTSAYDSNGQDLTIARPSDSATGDLLVLALHRTDDDLPLFVSGWTRAAECYKRDNGYDCSTAADCTAWHDSRFCAQFGSTGREGRDLAQAIFYRMVGSNEPRSYAFDLNRDSSGHPGWATLTALRGAATSNPVRDWAARGCDRSPDSLFPSAYGEKGDMLLLSQSFDDAIARSRFGAPSGTSTFAYVSQSDEAGFLFGGAFASSGESGVRKTQGEGGSDCKDALITLVVKHR